MASTDSRDYKINIDPRILELLGPSLYTNIYYVLAELIANAYDADASNVYIIEKDDRIIVEDDGTGMSYENGDIVRYLDVAAETRTEYKNVFSASGRRKRMGRKGVGKLAALSVSENVYINTQKLGEKSGFVLSRHVNADHQLTAIPEEKIAFDQIGENDGTSIVMTNPQYSLHKTPKVISKNLLKMFPLVDESFKVHITTERGEKITVANFDAAMVTQLGGLLILGEEFSHLERDFNSTLPEEHNDKMLFSEEGFVETLMLKNKAGVEEEYDLEIKGWLGVYRSSSGRKKDPNDFPDNFISLLSNKKLGEFNVLPSAGKNKLNEVYIVGQLHVDLFENTMLPDMALSNRQGYKSDDPRYVRVLSYVSEKLIPRMVNLRAAWGRFNKAEKEMQKLNHQREQEKELRKKVDTYKKNASEDAAKAISERFSNTNRDNIKDIIEDKLNELLPVVGLKQKIDQKKKKILISHSSTDKDLADVVYKMLSFNNVSDDEIIYSSCDEWKCRIPPGANLFDYLRDFFVDSYSSEKIFVIYVTSEEMSRSWNPVSEVGAGWITQSEHRVFNIEGHTPQKPLDTGLLWHTSKVSSGIVQMSSIQFDEFVVKIMDICTNIENKPKSKEMNEKELGRYVSLLEEN